MALGVVDDAERFAVLGAIKKDVEESRLYHPFSGEEIGVLFGYFDAVAARRPEAIPPFVLHASSEIKALVDAVTAFLSDDPLRVLEVTPSLYLWSETSHALARLVSDCEFLVRMDPAPRTKPYLANNGQSKYYFCVSYPRSGSTFLTHVIDEIIPQSRHSPFWGDGRYVSRWADNVTTAGDVVAKDHHFSNLQLKNKVVYVVRRFPGVLKSNLQYRYNELERTDPAARKEAFKSLASFLDFMRTGIEFGTWEAQAQDVLDCSRTNQNIGIFRYEDILGPNQASMFRALFTFLDRPPPSEDAIRTAQENVAAVRRGLLASNPDWAPLTNEAELPAFVADAVALPVQAWLQSLTGPERELVRAIDEGPVSRGLGY